MSFVLTQSHLTLILLLTDVIITAGQSLKQVNEMDEEEVKAAIVDIEEDSGTLMARLRAH